jgi:hypothetical protein
MRMLWPLRIWFFIALLLPTSPCFAQSPTMSATGEKSRAAEINEWTVGVAGGFLEGTFIRYAVELGKALDDGESLRVLPIVTYGSDDNMKALLYLKGVDVAALYTDTMEVYKRAGHVKDIDQRINYISQLLLGEFYVWVRPEIRSPRDLDGKTVSLGPKGSSATTTGPIVFERLGVHPNYVYLAATIAVEKMKTGEIAASVSTGAKPNSLFVNLKPEPGYHFLPIDYGPKFADYYVPCPLSHDDYPQLIPAGESVDTLCSPAVLAVYNFPKGSDRARRLERFIQFYFERFDRLLQPSFHPKWKEINLAAKVPGWNRYWLASERLSEVQKKVDAPSPVERPVSRSSAEQDLFQEFLSWRKQKGK